jgi:SPP1 gp7 family putative phage head morphogenesis protein
LLDKQQHFMTKKLFNNPDSQEREYTRLLLRLIKKLQSDINAILIPELGNLTRQYNAAIKLDSWTGDLQSLMTQLEVLGDSAASVVVSRLQGQFNEVSKFNDGQFKAVVKANTGLLVPSVMQGAPSSALLGVNVFRSEPFLAPLAEGWIAENTSLIKSLPKQLHGAVHGVVQRGVMSGDTVQVIKDRIRAQWDISENRAKLIAQDQTLKLNANLTRYRVQSVGVTKYIWRTVNDSRVRPQHADRNGNTYSFGVGANGENPAEPVRCRCRAEPIFHDSDDE